MQMLLVVTDLHSSPRNSKNSKNIVFNKHARKILKIWVDTFDFIYIYINLKVGGNTEIGV